jgi:hypothetical protein
VNPVALSTTTRGVTLYGLAEEIVSCLDTIEGLNETQDQVAIAEVQERLCEALERMPEKVDAFAGYVKRCDVEEQFLKTRAKEMTTMANGWAKRAERLKQYARGVIESLPLAKGDKYQKLQGKESSISLRAGRTSVAIESVEAVPREYRVITLEMPEELWVTIRRMWSDQKALDQAVKVVALTAPKTAIKAALEAGQEIPGAYLAIGEPTVVVS